MTFDFRHPNINPNASEKEQLQQLKTYVHQLVDELKWALNNVNSSQGNSPKSNNTGNTVGVEIINIPRESGATDFVIEAGEKNGWTYKKWKSGTFEMFGRFTVAANVEGTACGSMYYSEQFAIPTPFACSYAVVTGTATSWFIPITGGLANNDDPNNIGIRLFRPTAFAVGQESSVRLYATGEYM